jgi:uncharacterized membrane protein YdjX (TVP38/TMEM64 family)
MTTHQKSKKKRKKASIIRPLIFVLLIAGVIATQYFHPEQYLDKESLRQFAASNRVLLPVIYLMVWTLGPLFLPGHLYFGGLGYGRGPGLFGVPLPGAGLGGKQAGWY